MARTLNKTLALFLALATAAPPGVFAQIRVFPGEASAPRVQGAVSPAVAPIAILAPSLLSPSLAAPELSATSIAAPAPAAAASIPIAAPAPAERPAFTAVHAALAAPSDGPSAPRTGESAKAAADSTFDAAKNERPLDDSSVSGRESASAPALRPASASAAASIFDPGPRTASIPDHVRDLTRYHSLMAQSFWWYMYTHIKDMWPGYKSRWAKTRDEGEVAVSRPRAFFSAMRVTGMSGRFYMLGGSALEDDLVIKAFRQAFDRYFDAPGIGAKERAALEAFMQRAKGFNAERRSHTNMYKNIRDPLIKASTMRPDQLASYFDGLILPEKEMSTKEYQASGRMEQTKSAFLAVLRATLDEEDPNDPHRIRAGIVLGSFASDSAGPGSDFDVEALANGASNVRRAAFVKRLTDRWIAAGYHKTNEVSVHDRTSWPSWGLVNIVQTRHYLVVSPEPSLVARLSRQAFENPAVRLERAETFHGRVNRVVQRGIVAAATFASDIKAAFSRPAAKPSIEDPIVSKLTLKSPDAVLFDWDNTLADEREIWEAVVEDVFRELGVKMPAIEEVDRVWRTERESFYGRFFPGVPRDVVTKTFLAAMARARRGEEVGGKRFVGVNLLPGALEILKAFKARGIRLAVVSNKPEEELLQEMDKTNARGYFEQVLGRKEGRELKPSPAPIMEALQAMGVPLGNVWYVGDEPVDMQAASHDGIQRVLVGKRWSSAVKAQASGSDPAGGIVYVDGQRELLSVVRKLPPPR